MKNPGWAFVFLITLTGCDWKEWKAARAQGEPDRTFTTVSYNYTPDILHWITFKNSSLPFKIDEAPYGGSTYGPNGSEMALDNGEKVRYSADNCCFMWSGPLDKPQRIRVVWLVIHNLSYFNRQADEGYDERTSRKNPPGGRWCQAIVDIQPATGPDRPKMVFLHFLADGSVQAKLGTFLTAKPLPSAQVKSHSAPLPEGQVCKNEIDNPWYGIPRKPHRE
ncbi:MAG TPA: hypothetical protein VF800_19970 [Telluria sp.]